MIPDHECTPYCDIEGNKYCPELGTHTIPLLVRDCEPEGADEDIIDLAKKYNFTVLNKITDFDYRPKTTTAWNKNEIRINISPNNYTKYPAILIRVKDNDNNQKNNP